jgi:hypothetical protein
MTINYVTGDTNENGQQIRRRSSRLMFSRQYKSIIRRINHALRYHNKLYNTCRLLQNHDIPSVRLADSVCNKLSTQTAKAVANLKNQVWRQYRQDHGKRRPCISKLYIGKIRV